VDFIRAHIHAEGSTTRLRSASSISPKTVTASSEAAFRHLPTNERQASGPLPVSLASVFRPRSNKSDRTSRGASAPEALASEFLSSPFPSCPFLSVATIPGMVLE
jgi:hypothetical protein